MILTAADTYTCEKCNRILLADDIDIMFAGKEAIEYFTSERNCPVCYRLDSLRTIRKNFFSTDNDSFPWSSYTDYILALPDKEDYMGDAVSVANSMAKIDYFTHDTRVTRSDPNTVKVIASRDPRLLALMSLQWANGSNLHLATLDQLNTMLTFCYRYAVKIRQHNYMYSAAYVWPKQPSIEQNTITLGGHSGKDACYLPVPKIIQRNGSSLVIAYVSLYRLACSQVISELRYDHEDISDSDITCYAGMLPDGSISKVVWRHNPFTNMCLTEIECDTFSKYL